MNLIEQQASGCPSNWHYWRDHLYFLESEKKNFDESEASCEKLGGHLTSVLGQDETDFLLYLAVEGVNYWIGFTDREEEGNFKWLDGSPSNYTNWRLGQPNNVPPEENCAELLATADADDGKWNDLRCIFLITYFCKKPVTGGNEEIQLLLYGETDIIQASIHGGCSMPLGMGNNEIKDHQISASSFIDDAHMPQYARVLNQSFWMASLSDSQPWIQIHFNGQMVIAGLIVDGHLSMDLGWIWVDKFHVTYSNNGRSWKPYVYFTENDKCGQYYCEKTRNNKNEVVTIFSSRFACRRSLLFYHQIKATHLRLHPNISSKSYNERIKVGCKLEIIGCSDDDCDYSFGIAAGGITNINMSTSSYSDNTHSAVTSRVRIIPDIGAAGTGWIPHDKDSNPWLRVQMESVHSIRAIVTQGCGDLLAWITEYCVSFMNDSNSVVFYQGTTLSDCKVFQANEDNINLVRKSLDNEIETNEIVFHPISWHNLPCLRVELIGCAAGKSPVRSISLLLVFLNQDSIQNKIQRCEIDHVASCDFTRICNYPKGQIASLDYPSPYPQRSTCTWNIITDPGTFILLSFTDFDIPSLGDCTSSSVTIYNGDTQSAESAIGVYCNYRPPPKTVVSAFNHVFIAHTSGAEESGHGFYAEYAQNRHESSINVTIDPGDVCPIDWSYFRGNCHRLMYSENYINWVHAEENCMEYDAHLVSIRDRDDMEFIHSLIVDNLERHVSLPLRTYIGLTLAHDEWMHRWVDGRPLSYTDWISPNSEEEWMERQPDGGRLESCVLIDLTDVHSTNHWHDVPCISDNEANQYICMKPQSGVNDTTMTVTENLHDSVRCPDDMAVCSNGECIHKIFACADSKECLANKECEKGILQESSRIIGGSCRPGEFQCLRSHECISVSFLCDFITHCEDTSDEESCVYPPCQADEYTCSNGQCISSSKRCDLVSDCVSKSDEDMCDETKDSFQCYDGTWLPAHAQCDGQRDCSGKNWEDESLSECGIYQTNFTCTNGRLSCKNGACVDPQYQCVYNKDRYGFMQGCRDATHLENCGDFSCDKGMIKCPDSYCIPLRYRCDGSIDCPNAQDEQQCDTFQCPNHYRCKGSGNCLNHSELCDGVQHCPDGDDELFCGIKCPKDCVCLGLYFHCTDTAWDLSKALMIPENARELHLTNLKNSAENTANTIKARLHIDLSRMAFLVLANISGNDIGNVDTTTFESNRNLQVLSLAKNNITTILNGTFITLGLLKYLDISGNPLTRIQPGAFFNLNSLQFLNIERSLLKTGSEKTFNDLVVLETLHSDKYLFCCLVQNLELITECLPEPDQFSSCEDLIRIPVLRIFMWILGISALIGNGYVIAKRILPSERGSRKGAARVQNIMVGHLAVADSFMGVYMMIIASADVYYRDKYAFFAEDWQTSVVCKMAGLLSVLSSEASVFS
ncbi:uncharacterized protein [Amphiura filiformis]|uniref:uncharacterized protein n=1 Tax=Amphiura filiformis TaxID=82378 RepID=UPI003B20FFCB